MELFSVPVTATPSDALTYRILQLKHLTIHVGSRIDGHRRYSSLVASSTTNKTEVRRKEEIPRDEPLALTNLNLGAPILAPRPGRGF